MDFEEKIRLAVALAAAKTVARGPGTLNESLEIEHIVTSYVALEKAVAEIRDLPGNEPSVHAFG